jgi:hypothetical protein
LTAPAAADREPHPEAALLTKASFLKRMREQFPTLEKVAVPSLGGVAFRIVMAMKQHFAGEARAALLAAMTANMRPKIVIVVDPDIDVPPNAIGPVQVAFMLESGLRLPHAAGARHDRGRWHRRDLSVRRGDPDRGSPARQPRHLRPGTGREGARVYRGRGCAGVAGV